MGKVKREIKYRVASDNGENTRDSSRAHNRRNKINDDTVQYQLRTAHCNETERSSCGRKIISETYVFLVNFLRGNVGTSMMSTTTTHMRWLLLFSLLSRTQMKTKGMEKWNAIRWSRPRCISRRSESRWNAYSFSESVFFWFSTKRLHPIASSSLLFLVASWQTQRQR